MTEIQNKDWLIRYLQRDLGQRESEVLYPDDVIQLLRHSGAVSNGIDWWGCVWYIYQDKTRQDKSVGTYRTTFASFPLSFFPLI